MSKAIYDFLIESTKTKEYAITPDGIVRFYESTDGGMDYYDDPDIKIIYEN